MTKKKKTQLTEREIINLLNYQFKINGYDITYQDLVREEAYDWYKYHYTTSEKLELFRKKVRNKFKQLFKDDEDKINQATYTFLTTFGMTIDNPLINKDEKKEKKK